MALLDRVRAVMLQPQQAWPAIAMEPDTTQNILTSYVVPLVVFAAVCRGIGTAFLIGLLGPVYVIIAAIIGLLVGIASIFIIAQVVDALAPTFSAVKNPVQSMKVAAYAYTPAAVGAIFSIIPIFGALLTGLVSLYSIYQVYLGVIAAMGAPREKAVGYTAVAIIVSVIVIAIVSVVLGLVLVPFTPHLFTPHA